MRMRMAAMFCRNMRRLSSMPSQGSLGLVARSSLENPVSRVGIIDGSSNLLPSSVWFNVESRGAGGALATSRVGSLRFMGFGSFNEEHANAPVPDERFEDEGHDEETTEEAIEKVNQELFKQSNIISDPDEPLTEEVKDYVVKEHSAEKPQVDVAGEVWSAKEQDGTSPFSDDSDKVSSKA